MSGYFVIATEMKLDSNLNYEIWIQQAADWGRAWRIRKTMILLKYQLH